MKVKIVPNRIWIKCLDIITPIQVWWIVRFWRYSWVSARADQIIRKSSSRKLIGYLDIIRDKWDDWMHPENGIASLLVALVIVCLPQIILAFGLYRYLRLTSLYLEESKAIQSTLVAAWQVLASLIGIAFVIIVFLTQYAVDRQFERRALPLFASRTWMVYTVMMGLLTLLSMGINVLLFNMVADPANPHTGIVPDFLKSIALYNLILFAANIVFTIRLYIITYRLLSPQFFKQEFRKYLRKLVNKGVYTELRDRIAKKLLLEHCNQIGIDLSYYDHYPNKEQVNIPELSNIINEVVDVNLDLLQIVANRIKHISTSHDSKAVIFLGEMGRRLSAERPQIAFVSSDYAYRPITYPLQMASRIAPLAESNRSNLQAELLLNRDLMASAIRNGNSDEVENHLENYLETLRSFLQSFEAVGLRYSFEMAQKELSFFSNWPFVSSILEQYVHLLDLALKSDDAQIIHHFTGFPLQVMALAFQAKDHLLFRRFSNLYTVIYVRTTRFLENQELKRYVKDRCWRLLADFDRYQIAYAITNLIISNVEALTDYSIQLLLVLNRLIKSAIDQQDWEQYRLFSSAIRLIYKDVDGNYDQNHLEILKIRMELLADRQALETIEHEYEDSKVIISQKNRVESTRRVLMIGIGAWLIHLFETSRLTSSDLSNHLVTIAVEFLTVDSLYDAFSGYLINEGVHDLADWTSWELEEKPETPGEVTSSPLAFEKWLAYFYVIRMLELMPTNESMALPELKPFINSERTLDIVKQQLTQLESNPLWQEYLHVSEPIYKYRAKVLIQIHQKAADQQHILDEIELVHQPFDEDKIRAFAENVRKSWLDSATLRALFVYYNKYEPRPGINPPEGLLAFGVHELDDKGAYVNQNRVGYPDWGGAYGRSLGNSEDSILITDMLRQESNIVLEDELDEVIKQALTELRSLGYVPVILCESSILFERIYKSPHFHGRWRVQNSLLDQLGAEGLFEDTLVFNLREFQDKSIVLIDIKAYATLVQYRPTEKDDFPLFVHIEEITDVRAREILSNNQEWAIHTKTGEVLDDETAIRQIKRHVIIQISERFRLENINPQAGKVFRIIDKSINVPAQEATNPHAIEKSRHSKQKPARRQAARCARIG